MKHDTFVLTVLLVGAMAAVAAAQGQAPPIQGVTGTIATDSSREGVKKAAGSAARGVKKVLPAGKANAQDPLDVLVEGSRVVIQEGHASTEGTVVDVNRKRQQITVRFADKKTATLRVLDRSGASPSQGTHVGVSLADQAGDKIVYDFSRVS
jgi:hypothetical protein